MYHLSKRARMLNVCLLQTNPRAVAINKTQPYNWVNNNCTSFVLEMLQILDIEIVSFLDSLFGFFLSKLPYKNLVPSLCCCQVQPGKDIQRAHLLGRVIKVFSHANCGNSRYRKITGTPYYFKFRNSVLVEKTRL